MTNQSSFFAKSDSILENVNDNKEDRKKKTPKGCLSLIFVKSLRIKTDSVILVKDDFLKGRVT